MVQFKLPDDLLLGTATSGMQIEGGDTNSNWYEWCSGGHYIKGADSCIIGCDHWNRVKEDTQLLKNLNIQVHRLSVEWSRIEPTKGNFSKEAIAHYRNEIQLLVNNNITPLVTLHHFSEPLWFDKIGGWKKLENIEFFLNYVRHVVEELGDLVAEWVTFNEPNAFIDLGYLIGIWPPGEKGIRNSLKVKSVMINAHVQAYQLIHEIRKTKGFSGETMVGIAMHLRIFDSTTFWGNIIARFVDYFLNQIFMEGFTRGKFLFPLSRKGRKHKTGKYVDYLGINYYTRNVVEFTLSLKNWFHKRSYDKSLDKNDLGWDIYPEGMFRVCKRWYDKYQLPIYITENGICDQNDTKRVDFITNHLVYLMMAINSGIPVKRYCYWSSMDNFEFQEGKTARFGLYEINYNNLDRKLRRGGKFYGELILNRGVTEELYEKYQNGGSAAPAVAAGRADH